MPAVTAKTKREDLFQEIVRLLRRWPEQERKIFFQAHYHGQSPETISRSLNLNVEEVSRVLDRCDRQLNATLRSFRESQREKPTLILRETA